MAEGIPITPRDDAGAENPYPLLRITARDRATDEVLASVDVVVPVSDETDCRNCHATGGIAASDPLITWSSDPDLEIQTRTNVLILHDADRGTDLLGERPVLCARCHYSAALDLAGSGPQGDQLGKPFLSETMHLFHGRQLDDHGDPVFPPDVPVELTCYQCHPGAITRCARGVMAADGLECTRCHGDMLAVGGDSPLRPGGSIDGANDGQQRRPWIDVPRCQSCHTGDAIDHLEGAEYRLAGDGFRLRQAFRIGDGSASPIEAPRSRFREQQRLAYRFSVGHGGVACQHCHGSTHAEWPTIDPNGNDNETARQLQGHVGTILECGTCHDLRDLPLTIDGPHGLHNVGDVRWEDGGHAAFFRNDPARCQACHGADLEGTPLARVATQRAFPVLAPESR